MNDLGLTLAWLAVQVSLVLVPAAALCALAARRSPSAGAWAASLSLGLVVTLNAVAFLPDIGGVGRVAENDRIAVMPRPADAAAPSTLGNDAPRPTGSRGLVVHEFASRLGPARARGGRAGGAVPAVGGHAGGPGRRRDGRRPAPACTGPGGDRRLPTVRPARQ